MGSQRTSWTWLNDWTTTATMENSMEIWRLLLKRKVGLRYDWTALVAQWIRIHLPMQGTQVRSLVWDDSTCCGTTTPEGRNDCVHALGPVSCNYWACVPQRVKPTCLRAHVLQLLGQRAAIAEAWAPKASARQPETPSQREARAPQGRAAPALHS